MPLAAETAVLATGGGETTDFTVLVHGVADPIDSGVVAHDLVHGVNHDHFVVLVHGIFIEPVRVQDAQGAAAASGALFSHGAQVAREFQLLHTLVNGLTVADTLVHGSLAAAATHARAVDAKALLGLVPEAPGLVGARGARDAHHGGELAVLPHAHALKEAEYIALLLLPKFLNVLVSLERVGEDGRNGQ